MGEPRDPTGRSLQADERRRLLEVHLRIDESFSTPELLRELVSRISDIVHAKVALVGKREDEWVVLGESGAAPALPPREHECWGAIEHVGTSPRVATETIRCDGDDWTILGLTKRSHAPTVLVLEGDWRPAEAALLQLAHNLLFAERTVTLSSLAQVGLLTHRLSRTLARVTGTQDVCHTVLRHMLRAVPSRLGAFAVPGDAERLAIVATEGYPLALVEHLRIDPGTGVIGSVYRSRTPLRVTDVSTVPGLRRRSRYRTKSFVALPVTAGAEVLGVVCVADRLDDQVFTRENVSALRALAAPAALALERERVRTQAQSYAHASVIDPVSGLFNRRYFHPRLEEEIQRADRHKMPVGLVMLDIDDFKGVNDRFGHLAGDTVIAEVADIVRRSVRVFDVCTRFGGEEFAILMPGTGPESAANIAERIRHRIEQYRSSERELASLRVTASLGLAMYSEGVSARDLIQRADHALYVAKRAGKNQVRIGDDNQLLPPKPSSGPNLTIQ